MIFLILIYFFQPLRCSEDCRMDSKGYYIL